MTNADAQIGRCIAGSFLLMMADREDERNEPTHASNLRFIAKELERLQSIVGKLPKCWRLVGGKLVQDAPIAPDATVFVPAEVLELSVVSKFRVASVGSDCVIVTNDCGLRFAAQPEQLCNTEEAAEAAREETLEALTP